MKNFLFLLLFLGFSAEGGEKHLLLMGGGGESISKNDTIFDPQISVLGDFISSSSSNWKYDVSFNGGHSTTDAMLKQKFKNAQSNNSFSPANFSSVIEENEKKIRSGQIKRGDQLMVVIDSHGAQPDKGSKTHVISAGVAYGTTDLEKLSSSITVSLDGLSTLSALALEKGIKLAIVDMSCHSGATLNLANDNTCVISSTSSDLYGYGDFSVNFAKNLKDGKSLEEVFLEARRMTSSPGYPMISTAANKIIADEYQSKLRPYFTYKNSADGADKVTKYIKRVAENEQNFCEREDSYKELKKQLALLRETTDFAVDSARAESLDRLDLKIKKYKETQDSVLFAMKKLEVSALNKKEVFRSTIQSIKKNKKSKKKRIENNYYESVTELTWEEILKIDVDNQLEHFVEMLKKETSSESAKMLRDSISIWEQVKEKKEEILSEHPSLNNYEVEYERHLAKLNETYEVARQISEEERNLYQHLYENASKQSTKKNPCKDFIL